MKKGKMILTTLLVGAIFLLAACGNNNNNNTNEAAGDATYPNEKLLVEVNWLNEQTDDVVIIDARSSGFEEGHIPGAVNVTAGSINDANNEVDGFLLAEDEFGELFRSAGVNNDSTIVVYDGGNALHATRIFYALEYYGLFDQVKVLNGGYPAWLTAGYDISVDPVEPTEGNFVAKANENLVTTKDQVLEELESDNVVILDTRSEDEFTGENPRNNKHGGHIPGAVHREWTDALTEDENGLQRFLSPEDLRANFETIGVEKDKTVITYCQTNVRGAHSYFALRLLGYEDIRPYEGSWAEWGNLDNTPITTAQAE